jgi:hypothetical protein
MDLVTTGVNIYASFTRSEHQHSVFNTHFAGVARQSMGNLFNTTIGIGEKGFKYMQNSHA